MGMDPPSLSFLAFRTGAEGNSVFKVTQSMVLSYSNGKQSETHGRVLEDLSIFLEQVLIYKSKSLASPCLRFPLPCS